MEKNCIFCNIINGNISCKKILESNEMLSFKDANPIALNHLLIVPKIHISNIAEINICKNKLSSKIFFFINEVVEKENINKSYRLVINKGEKSGQSISHFHIHLLSSSNKMCWPPC